MAPPSASPLCPDRKAVLRAVRARKTDGPEPSVEERHLLLAHLSSCDACRVAAVSLDPTLLFAPLAASVAGAGPGGEGDGERMASDVRAVIEARRFDLRVRRRSRTLQKVAAIVLIGAGLAGFAAFRQLHSERESPAELGPAPEAAARAVAVAGRVPLIEGVESPSAKVYQFDSETPGQPSIVFVVDRNADL